jgi:hypothetical protein
MCEYEACEMASEELLKIACIQHRLFGHAGVVTCCSGEVPEHVSSALRRTCPFAFGPDTTIDGGRTETDTETTLLHSNCARATVYIHPAFGYSGDCYQYTYAVCDEMHPLLSCIGNAELRFELDHVLTSFAQLRSDAPAERSITNNIGIVACVICVTLDISCPKAWTAMDATDLTVTVTSPSCTLEFAGENLLPYELRPDWLGDRSACVAPSGPEKWMERWFMFTSRDVAGSAGGQTVPASVSWLTTAQEILATLPPMPENTTFSVSASDLPVGQVSGVLFEMLQAKVYRHDFLVDNFISVHDNFISVDDDVSLVDDNL